MDVALYTLSASRPMPRANPSLESSNEAIGPSNIIKRIESTPSKVEDYVPSDLHLFTLYEATLYERRSAPSPMSAASAYNRTKKMGGVGLSGDPIKMYV